MTPKASILLGLCCTLVLSTGCASSGISLTNDQRSSLRKLLFIPSDEEVSVWSNDLRVVRSASGERVSLRRTEMSRAEYEARRAAAAALLEECLSTTYGANVPTLERFSSSMSELIANENPFDITFVHDVKLEEFIDLEPEEARAFLAEYGADGVLTMRAFHRAGLTAFGLRGIVRTGAETSLFALVLDREGIVMHRTDQTTTELVQTDEPGFCEKYTDRFERALEELPPQWYAEIVGND